MHVPLWQQPLEPSVSGLSRLRLPARSPTVPRGRKQEGGQVGVTCRDTPGSARERGIKQEAARPSWVGARRRCPVPLWGTSAIAFPDVWSKSGCWGLTPRDAGMLRLGVGVQQMDGGQTDSQNVTEPWPAGSAPLHAGGFAGVGNLMGWWPPSAGGHQVPTPLLPGVSPLQAAVRALSLCHGHHEGSLGPGTRRARQRLPGEGAAASRR